MDKDRRKGGTRDASPTFRVPAPPSGPANKAPLQEIPLSEPRQGTTDKATSTSRLPSAQERATTTRAKREEVRQSKKRVDKGKGITQDSTSSVPTPPGQSMAVAPAPRKTSSTRTHHHHRSWAAPLPRINSGKIAKPKHSFMARQEEMMMARKDSTNQLAKVIITATNMNTAAMMSSASLLAQAIDRQTDAIKASGKSHLKNNP